MSTPSFRDAYFAGDAAACALLPRQFADGQGRAGAVGQAAAQGLSVTVRDELVRQNLPFASETTHRQLERLHHANVTFVVTGQQIGLFGGPLYAMHKAASAIQLAAQLEAESGTPVIPVFWLQTEDHDAVEISSATLVDGRDRVHTHTVALPDAGRRSVAHLTLPADVDSIIAELAQLRGQSPEHEQATALLRRCWYAGRPVHEAFAEYVMATFGHAGLLVFQPRSHALAHAAAPLHEWAIAKQKEITLALQIRVAELQSAGFGVQIPIRSNCSLSFVHPDTTDGPRFRLQWQHDQWVVPGDTGDLRPLTDAQLQAWLSSEPLRFSTSALLRPLLQDLLLPTAAWIGGPAEVHYMAQVFPLYAMRGQRYPLFVPRASLLWVPEPFAALLEQLQLTPRDLAHGAVEAARRAHSRSSASSENDLANRISAALLTAFDDTIARFDPELAVLGDDTARATQKTRQHLVAGLEKYAQKVERSLLMQQHDHLQVLERAAAWFWPAGQPQERTAAWWSISGRLGGERAADLLLANASPVLPSPREIRL